MSCASLRVSSIASGTTPGNPSVWPRMPYAIRNVCVMKKPRKIGNRILIDSFMPRRFITSSTATSDSSVPSLNTLADAGSMLNSASTPLATEIAIVST